MRRVTHRTAFAANNYVRDFSVAMLRPPSPPPLSLPPSSPPSLLSLPLFLALTHFLSFLCYCFFSCLTSTSTNWSRKLRDSLARSSSQEFVPRSVRGENDRYATYAQQTAVGLVRNRNEQILRDAVVTRRSRGYYAHKFCSKRIFKYLLLLIRIFLLSLSLSLSLFSSFRY